MLKDKRKIIIAAVSLIIIAAVIIFILLKDGSKVVDVGDLSSYISPGQISLSDKYAYVSDETKNQVYKVNLSNNKIEKNYSFDDQVNGILYSDDKVYVLTGGLAGNLVVMDADLKKDAQKVAVGHTPVDAVIFQDRIYVANRFSNSISVIDKNKLEKIKDISVSREPMALAVSGNSLFVASHLPDDAFTDDVVAADVSVINLSNDEVTSIKLSNGTSGVKDICSSPDGKYVYLTHILARYAYPTSQVDRGWINTNAISIIDAENKTLVNSVMLDGVEAGAANPWGIQTNDDGSKIIVSLAGSHEIMVIDANMMFEKIKAVNDGNGVVEKPSDIPNYLPFLDGARTRINLSGKGPRSIALKNEKLYICQYFSGNIAVMDINSKNIEYVALGEQPEINKVRQGQILWHDAETSYQEWQSCSSCHPDARVDGFSWDELGDGLGDPKNTRSLLKTHVTQPILITGSGSAEAGVRGSFDTLMFKKISEEQAVAIDEYLKSLKPVSSPYLKRDGTLTEEAKRGKELFEQNSCVACHPAPFFTDTLKHNVNTVDDNEKNNEDGEFDTPTLLEVWRTAPWLFNGKSNSIKEAIVKHLPEGVNFIESQLEDLVKYVLSIGSEGEFYSIEQIRVEVKENEVLVNKLVPGGTIREISFRKQWDTDKKATATLEIFDSNNKSIFKHTEKLENLSTDSKVAIPVKIKIPDDLKQGSYIKVTITDSSNKDNKLASDYYIRY